MLSVSALNGKDRHSPVAQVLHKPFEVFGNDDPGGALEIEDHWCVSEELRCLPKLRVQFGKHPLVSRTFQPQGDRCEEPATDLVRLHGRDTVACDYLVCHA